MMLRKLALSYPSATLSIWVSNKIAMY